MNIKFFNKSEQKKRLKLIKKLEYGHGYSILRSSKSLKNNEFLLELSRQYDNYGYMSQELGEELDNLFLDDDYIIGIHRTGYTYMDNDTIENIFSKGLINNGHVMQGGNAGNYSIESTVSLFQDFTLLNGQLKSAHGYKCSEGCFIIKIPKSYLGKKDGEIKPIYYKDGKIVKLLPEFIYGYVPVNGEGKLGEIIRNPKYKDKHDLNDDNLFYDEAGYYKAKRMGINLDKSQITINDKYQIIKEAYEDTVLKYGDYQAEQALLRLINNKDVQCFTGKENREKLSGYVVQENILDILSYGLDDIDNPSINDIISGFINGSKQSLENKSNVK